MGRPINRRIEHPITLTAAELETVLDALATATQKYADRSRRYRAVDAYSRAKAAELATVHAALIARRYQWITETTT